MSRAIVVVDRRTYHKAIRQVADLADLGDDLRAWAGAVAICGWLRDTVRHSRRASRRIYWAHQLEHWEAEAQRLHQQHITPLT